jgi:hypothetical protein
MNAQYRSVLFKDLPLSQGNKIASMNAQNRSVLFEVIIDVLASNLA